MSIQLIDGFQLNVSLPIDNKIVASGSSARNNIPYKYEGLRTFDTYDGISYVWYNNAWQAENPDIVNVENNMPQGLTTSRSSYIPFFTGGGTNENNIGSSIIFQKQRYVGPTSVYNIGIGTTTPNNSYKLDVNGGILCSNISGDGSSLTNLNASNISSGSIGVSYITNGTSRQVLMSGVSTPSWSDQDQLSVATSSVSLTLGSTNSTIFKRIITGTVRVNYNSATTTIIRGTGFVASNNYYDTTNVYFTVTPDVPLPDDNIVVVCSTDDEYASSDWAVSCRDKFSTYFLISVNNNSWGGGYINVSFVAFSI